MNAFEDKKQLEEGLEFRPRLDQNGLIPCITQSAKTGHVLMMAWMNEEAIAKTIQTGEVHYWSRSRGEIWHKGATSGEIQKLVSLRTDCDQDCLLALVEVQCEPEKACHTGRESCFYRELSDKDTLKF